MVDMLGVVDMLADVVNLLGVIVNFLGVVNLPRVVEDLPWGWWICWGLWWIRWGLRWNCRGRCNSEFVSFVSPTRLSASDIGKRLCGGNKKLCDKRLNILWPMLVVLVCTC